MKIYINKEGVPMVSRTGWPEKPSFKVPATDTGYLESAADHYGDEWVKEMERANRDAVPLESNLTFHMQYIAGHKYDSFIDVDIQVEFVKQHRTFGGVKWFDYKGDHEPSQCEQRTIARVVLEKSENAANLDSAGEPIPEGYRQCPRCNGCGETAPDVECKKCQGSGFIEKQDNGAHSYTEAAYDMPADEKKWRDEQHENDKKMYTEESRLFGVLMHSILSSGEDPSEAHGIATALMPDVQEYMKQQLAAAKARINELEGLIKSDVVHALLRFGYKNPCGSGCDDFEGSENVDLYNISNELRTKTEG